MCRTGPQGSVKLLIDTCHKIAYTTWKLRLELLIADKIMRSVKGRWRVHNTTVAQACCASTELRPDWCMLAHIAAQCIAHASTAMFCLHVSYLQVIAGVQQARNAKTTAGTLSNALAASTAGNAAEAFQYMQQAAEATASIKGRVMCREVTALLPVISKRRAKVIGSTPGQCFLSDTASVCETAHVIVLPLHD
jgi:hypothetical protein